MGRVNPTRKLTLIPEIKRERERTQQMTLLKNFVNDEQGQDLIEYTLLLAFVALASAAVFIGAGSSISGIWTAANTRLQNANAVAAS
jgi:Flp pilus assembly pilin Flp